MPRSLFDKDRILRVAQLQGCPKFNGHNGLEIAKWWSSFINDPHKGFIYTRDEDIPLSIKIDRGIGEAENWESFREYCAELLNLDRPRDDCDAHCRTGIEGTVACMQGMPQGARIRNGAHNLYYAIVASETSMLIWSQKPHPRNEMPRHDHLIGLWLSNADLEAIRQNIGELESRAICLFDVWDQHRTEQMPTVAERGHRIKYLAGAADMDWKEYAPFFAEFGGIDSVQTAKKPRPSVPKPKSDKLASITSWVGIAALAIAYVYKVKEESRRYEIPKQK